MAKRNVVIGSVVALVLAGAGGGAAWRYVSAQRADDDAARASLTALAAAWTTHDVTAVPFVNQNTQASYATTLAGLLQAPVTVDVTDVSRDGTRATANVAVAWTLPGGATWSYTVPVATTKVANSWSIADPATGTSLWAPGIKAEDTISVKRVWGTRGDLLDGAGTPLMPLGTVYPVQLDPVRATPAAASALEKVVDEPAGSLVAKLAAAKKAGSQAPIPVITYRQSDFDQRRAALDAIVGVNYPKTTQPLATSRTFAQPLLGSFGEVSAEMVKDSQGFYIAGDRAGLSGLQGAYDRQLAGTPGVSVTSSTGKELFAKPAVDGKDVQTSLDPKTQAAAEAALARTGDVPAALVTIDIPTGNVTSIANTPASGYNRAATGQYPPGSTFKIVSTYALLTAGMVTPQTPVACPRTFTVDGRSFRNFEGETLGSPTFAQDFAHSCNTAFIQFAQKLNDTQLNQAATALGLGGAWAKTVGVTGAYAGQVPTNNGATDKVAAAIGQGRDLASPLAMANVVANVARGARVDPALVQTSAAPRPATPLDATAIATIKTLMRQVVTGGTGTAVAGVPGGPVTGKSGTAEYGPGPAPKARVWFVGTQGDVAFAVMVEDGTSGGSVAAPIAADFLRRLN